MPSPGTNSETNPGKFHILCEDYTEKLTFTLVKGRVRKRAGTNEQFCGAVKYNRSIRDLRSNGLHEESGMYLYIYLNEIYKHSAAGDYIETGLGAPELSSGAGVNGPTFIPFYTVPRRGTIHHAWQHFSDSRKRPKASREAL